MRITLRSKPILTGGEGTGRQKEDTKLVFSNEVLGVNASGVEHVSHTSLLAVAASLQNGLIATPLIINHREASKLLWWQRRPQIASTGVISAIADKIHSMQSLIRFTIPSFPPVPSRVPHPHPKLWALPRHPSDLITRTKDLIAMDGEGGGVAITVRRALIFVGGFNGLAIRLLSLADLQIDGRLDSSL